MPIFVVHAVDKPKEGPAIRAENRPAHLEWAAELGEKLRVAGPLLSDDSEQMVGSLLIIEFSDLQALKAHMQTDPYVKAGLFERMEIRPYKWLIGNTRQPSLETQEGHSRDQI